MLRKTRKILSLRSFNTIMKYPTLKRDETISEVRGSVQVKDPYRWLEDPDSDETKQFVQQQNELFTDYIQRYPNRQKFADKLTAIYDYEKFGCPFKRGDYYYYFHNSGLQAQSVLYRLPLTTSEEGTEQQEKAEMFFDPNKLSKDGTAALSTFGFSESGKYFGYGVSYSGSDWVTIMVKDTSTLEDLEGVKVEWAKFTRINWTHDDKGFFYSRYPKPSSADAGTETQQNTNAELRYRLISDSNPNNLNRNDFLILKDAENPQHMFGATVSDDGKFAILTVSESCDPVNKLYLLDLSKSKDWMDKPQIMKIVDDFKAEYSYITNTGNLFYFKTNLNAPRYKIVSFNLDRPKEGFQDLIAESRDVLQDCSCICDNRLVAVYLKDVKNTISVFDLSTGELIRDLPVEIGSIDSLTGRRQDKEMFFKLSSFTNPGVIYRHDLSNPAKPLPKVYRETKLNIPNLTGDQLETRQIFYESKDGTKIPMFIISQRNLQLNNKNPVLLYGYGGFNIPLTPMFSPAWIAFIRHMGGVVAVANLRGGGEYGEEWHKAGSLHFKQNVFDDFQYAARWLVDNGYTQHSRLAINGGSNGGLLVAACLNQAPELFGCAMADVGVMDMLRFHKFTIGHAWKSDYGDPDKQADFEYLMKYSPVHNVQTSRDYPHTLLLTSDHDDRVVPLHSYKYIAALQHAHPNNPSPLLIRVETKAGHGAGKPTKKKIEEATDRFSFLSLAIETQWQD